MSMQTPPNPNQSPKVQKHLFIKDLKAKDEVRSSFMVKSKDLLWNKNGKAYLAMVLSDKTGDIETRVWEEAEALTFGKLWHSALASWWRVDDADLTEEIHEHATSPAASEAAGTGGDGTATEAETHVVGSGDR